MIILQDFQRELQDVLRKNETVWRPLGEFLKSSEAARSTQKIADVSLGKFYYLFKFVC